MSDRTNHLPSPLAVFKLRQFGQAVTDCLDETPYLVGSVLERSDYRDVDVRIMLDDERFAAMFGGAGSREDDCWITNGALRLVNMGLSALAREMTGLNVDCQIQRQGEANAHYGERHRQPLRPLR